MCSRKYNICEMCIYSPKSSLLINSKNASLIYYGLLKNVCKFGITKTIKSNQGHHCFFFIFGISTEYGFNCLYLFSDHKDMHGMRKRNRTSYWLCNFLINNMLMRVQRSMEFSEVRVMVSCTCMSSYTISNDGIAYTNSNVTESARNQINLILI